ncbi:hypothetical protein HaLaN_16023, partial [Haematococcus lacustris]
MSNQFRSPQHGRLLHRHLRITPHLLASGALILASEPIPAQASADTPQLLTIDCSSGGVGRPSWG